MPGCRKCDASLKRRINHLAFYDFGLVFEFVYLLTQPGFLHVRHENERHCEMVMG